MGVYAGNCGSDTFGDPVAKLTNISAPSGNDQGAPNFMRVEESLTTIDISLDDILADNHVLVVFDRTDARVPVACGAIGGSVGQDGSLAIGLPEVAGSGYAGIAYLAPDGDQTRVSVFIAKNLSGTEATPAP